MIEINKLDEIIEKEESDGKFLFDINDFIKYKEENDKKC